MSEFNIEVEGGSSVRLPTAGKYCDRDIVVTATGGGAEVYMTKYGRIYTPYVDYTGKIFNAWNIGNAALAETEHLIEVNFAGWPSIIAGSNSNPLQNSGVQRAYFPNLTSSNTYVFENCPNLVECVLGGVGYAVTSLYNRSFAGTTNNRDLVITVYVNALTLADIPTAVKNNLPGSATNATVIYRNSTTGEVITE